MAPITLLLITLASILHAGWNALSKSRQPSTAFFLVSTLAGGILLSPALLLQRAALPAIPLRVWGLLLGTGFCMALYYGALAGAYRHGHLSVAYPLARSSPILIVAVVSMALGRGAQISRFCMVGAVLVVAGCFLLPMKRLDGFHVRDYWNASCGLALLAAVGTTGYTILDDEALRLLRNMTEIRLGPREKTLLYAALETCSTALWLAVGLLLNRTERAGFRREIRKSWAAGMAAGAAIWTSYLLILFSLAFVSNVSYVAAFRQLSIPLGVLFGVWVLKEPACVPKIAGVILIVTGLVLVAVG